MRLVIRLRGPHVTIRQRGGWFWGFCLRLPKGNKLVKMLPFLCLAIILASLGLLAVSEVGVAQRRAVGNPGNGVGGRLLPRLSHSQSFPIANRQTKHVHPPTGSTVQGDVFKIEPLLRRNAPSVELSAQIILNDIYTKNIKTVILKFYEFVNNATRTYILNNSDASYTNFTFSDNINNGWYRLKDCPKFPKHLVGLSKISNNVSLTLVDMEEKIAKQIRRGGYWKPRDCISRHKVAIVIPYRDRHSHLITLLNHLHPILQKQQLQYRIFVVEQYGNETFNKGTIMNAAFREALKYELFHCFIFHDVDMIPETDFNLYTCPQMPRHLSVAVNEFNYKLPYKLLVGGVFAIRTEHFLRVNGYSNLYWGWGGEDDDMAYRLQQSGLLITRPSPNIGRYTMIKHVKRKPLVFKVRVKLLRTSTKRYRLDGMNTVQYQLINTTYHEWFTKFFVNIGPQPSNIKAIEKAYD